MAPPSLPELCVHARKFWLEIELIGWWMDFLIDSRL